MAIHDDILAAVETYTAESENFDNKNVKVVIKVPN